ncbi:Glycosyl phosphatidyl inositol anchor synthesis, partial [Coemansia helicoidea]
MAPAAAAGKEAPGHDGFSRGWGLERFRRTDVNQADIAPLMAALIGVDFPLNSVGTLPLDYLDASAEFRARAALTNALQVLEQYRVKHDEKQHTELFFRPYAPLHQPTNDPEHMLARIRRDIAAQSYAAAEAECAQLVRLCIEGLRYFQRYDWLLLRSIVSLGYLGWIVHSLLFILREYVLAAPPAACRSRHAGWIATAGGLVFAAMAAVFYRQGSPAMYYAYTLFPVYFWADALQHGPLVRQIAAGYAHAPTGWQPLAFAAGYVLVLEALVYAYFDRRVYTAVFVALAVAWPLGVSARFRRQHGALLALWSGLCLLTSVFTLLPVERNSHWGLVAGGGAIAALSGLGAWQYSAKFTLPPPGAAGAVARLAVARDRLVILCQTLLVGLAAVLGPLTSKETERRGSLPRVHQLACWAVLVAATLVPLAHGAGRTRDQHFLHRLVTIYLGFAAPF